MPAARGIPEKRHAVVPAEAGTHDSQKAGPPLSRGRRLRALTRLLFIPFLVVASLAVAQDQNAALDRRVMNLAHELRCLVCQNETLADSQAPLAADLRNQIREQLAAGKSEQQVVDFLVARYGDFVLYRPPLKGTTLLLWAGPFLFLAAGAFLLVRLLRRRRVPAPELSAAERSRAAKLLE